MQTADIIYGMDMTFPYNVRGHNFVELTSKKEHINYRQLRSEMVSQSAY